MSEASLGVLRMPEELALADDVAKAQFFAHCRWAADEIERLQAINAIQLPKLPKRQGRKAGYNVC